MADLTNVFPLCASGGCILFHDICHPAHRYLTACFDEFVDRYKNEIAESLKITDELGIGVIVKKSLADRKEQEHRDRYARLRCRD